MKTTNKEVIQKQIDQIKQKKEMLIRELSITNNRLDLIRNSIYNIYSAIETIDNLDILKLNSIPLTTTGEELTDNLDILVQDIINILPKKGKNEKK